MTLKKLAEMPPRKRLGILAILMGFLAIFAGNPIDKNNVTIDLKELSHVSPDQISKVKVEKLADDIIKSKYDYRLIDLRDPAEYSKYNIPTSENIKVADLLNSDLARNEKIILYSDNDIETTQGWFLLTANKYKGVDILEGGLKVWQNNVLFPNCKCGINPSKEQLHKHNKLAEVSKFFGGKMQSGNIASSRSEMVMPELKAPTTVKLKKAKGKRKREGC